MKNKKGHVEIETQYRYPDGSSVMLYVPKDRPEILTDFGNTFQWIGWLGIDAESDKNIDETNRIISVYDTITIEGGCLNNVSSRPFAEKELARICKKLAEFFVEKNKAAKTRVTYHAPDGGIDAEGKLFVEPNETITIPAKIKINGRGKPQLGVKDR